MIAGVRPDAGRYSCRAVNYHTGSHRLLGPQTEAHPPLAAGFDSPKAVLGRIGGVGGIGPPRLRLGAAVGYMPAVVPERPVDGLFVGFVEGPYPRPEVLDQRSAEGAPVDVDFTHGECSLDGVALRHAQPFAAQPGKVLGKGEGAPRRDVAPVELDLLADGHAEYVILGSAVGEGNPHRRMEPHTYGHRLPAPVGEEDLLLEAIGRQAEGYLALELVREVAENRVVARIGVVAALEEYLLVRLPRLRDGEGLTLEDSVVVMVLLDLRDGQVVGASAEGEGAVRNAVGRKEHRQAEDVGTPLEGLDFIGRRGTQNLHAEPHVGQPHKVGPEARNEQRLVVALAELHGLQPVPVDTAQHRLEQLFDFGGQRLLRAGAHLLVDQFALLEEDDGRDVAYAVLHRQLVVLLDVALADEHAALVCGGQFVDDGRHHAAGTAPLGPEIDYYRKFRRENFLNILLVDC